MQERRRAHVLSLRNGQRQANALFTRLVEVGAQNGWGEYRTHTLFYDEVARSYDYNNGAMLRWNERVKDAIDPQGIIAPGKMGIWPRRYREAV